MDVQPTKVIAYLLTDYVEKFDGDIQSISIPKEVLGDMPCAVLESSDQQYRFEVGPSRLSVQWKSQTKESNDLGGIVNECVEILTDCVSHLSVRIGRLALVISRVCPCDTPSQSLIDRFCTESAKQEPFNRSTNFEIHNHKEYVLPSVSPSLTINSWVRCKTKPQAIAVEQDLNTRAEDTDDRQFSTSQLDEFFSVATLEANDILAKYFPG